MRTVASIFPNDFHYAHGIALWVAFEFFKLLFFCDVRQTVFAQVKNLASQNQKLRQARDLLLPRLMNEDFAV